jgi:F-type H+-transporting ATPase subunit b
MELLKLLSTSEIIAQVINFLLLLILMRVFFWKKVLKLLDERRDRISSQLEHIENTKKEIEELKLDYETQLNAIEDIKNLKIGEAVEEGRKESAEIKKEAQLNAQRIMDSAESDIKQEIAKAREELKDEIVNLTMKAVENIAGEKLSEKNDKKLIEDFLSGLDKKQ